MVCQKYMPNQPKKLTVPEHYFKQKKSSAWYVRLVPSETLRTKFGVKEFRKSTGQAELRKAKVAGQTLIADKLRQWESLLSSPKDRESHAIPSILSDSLIETICSARLYSWLRSDEEERLDGVDDKTLLEIEQFGQLSDTAMRAILSQGKASAKWTETTDLVLDWCSTMGFEIDLEDPSTPKLIREFAKVERKAHQFILQRNNGEDITTPPPPSGPQPKLSDITKMYLEHKSIKSGKSHSNTSVNAWLLFIQFAGDIPFQSVTTPLIKNFFKDRLHSKNKPWSEKRVTSFGKRTLSEVFALAVGEGMFQGLNPVDQLTLLPALSKEEEASRGKPAPDGVILSVPNTISKGGKVLIAVCRDSEKLTFSARRQSRHQLADSASCWRGEHASPKSLWVCQKTIQRASSQPATAATATTSTGDWRPYTNKPNAANASPKSPRE